MAFRRFDDDIELRIREGSVDDGFRRYTSPDASNTGPGALDAGLGARSAGFSGLFGVHNTGFFGRPARMGVLAEPRQPSRPWSLPGPRKMTGGWVPSFPGFTQGQPTGSVVQSTTPTFGAALFSTAGLLTARASTTTSRTFRRESFCDSTSPSRRSVAGSNREPHATTPFSAGPDASENAGPAHSAGPENAGPAPKMGLPDNSTYRSRSFAIVSTLPVDGMAGGPSPLVRGISPFQRQPSTVYRTQDTSPLIVFDDADQQQAMVHREH